MMGLARRIGWYALAFGAPPSRLRRQKSLFAAVVPLVPPWPICSPVTDIPFPSSSVRNGLSTRSIPSIETPNTSPNTSYRTILPPPPTPSRHFVMLHCAFMRSPCRLPGSSYIRSSALSQRICRYCARQRVWNVLV